MRTHVELDEKVLAQVMDLGQFSSKRAAVQTALYELARTLKRKQLLALQGQVPWQADLDTLRGPRTTGQSLDGR